MLLLRLWLLMVSAALLAGGVGCKKSSSKSAEQQPTAEQSTPPPTEASAPAPESAAPSPQANAPAPSATPPQVNVPATVTLRGAPEVMAALNRKDYGAAVVLLTGIKSGIKLDQQVEYNELMRTVRGALFEAKATNPSANAAFEALRRIEAGR